MYLPNFLFTLFLSLLQVWVLTGDKEETAVNISQSAGHFDDSMSLLGFTSQTSEADAYSNLLNLKDRLVFNVSSKPYCKKVCIPC